MGKQKISAIRGMNDMLPEESPLWEKFEDTTREVAASYGFRQIRTPILESTSLFVRGVGEVTDIVEKEMYSFTDSMNGEQLTLRPECTSAVVRSVIEHNLCYNAPQRMWYFGPMFRHERPQRGRYRQFFQFGCEALGFAGPDVDIDMLAMVRRLWRDLGIMARLELNSLGQSSERAAHREALIAYFEAHKTELDEEAQHRLYANPLRILDTKDPDMQDLVNKAPKLLDYLGEDSRRFLDGLEKGISALGIEYTINPRLVRGLDYYNHTVFEWITDELGAQGTICGGGRYDPLVEMLGGRPTPAVGFAIGAERVIELMKAHGGVGFAPTCRVYVLHRGEETEIAARALGEKLRDAGIATIVHEGALSFKTQMKRADASGALYAVIVGEDEVKSATVSIKRLRDENGTEVFSEQRTIPVGKLLGAISDQQ